MSTHEPLSEEGTGKVGLHTGSTILVVEDDEGLNKLVVK
jgi:hypothetical protein